MQRCSIFISGNCVHISCYARLEARGNLAHRRCFCQQALVKLHAYAANNLSMGAWGKSPTKRPEGKSDEKSGLTAATAALSSLAKQYDKRLLWRLEGNLEQRIKTLCQPVFRFVPSLYLLFRVSPRLTKPRNNTFQQHLLDSLHTHRQHLTAKTAATKLANDFQLLPSGKGHLMRPVLQTTRHSRPASL